jgi:hypothetical protein
MPAPLALAVGELKLEQSQATIFCKLQTKISRCRPSGSGRQPSFIPGGSIGLHRLLYNILNLNIILKRAETAATPDGSGSVKN